MENPKLTRREIDDARQAWRRARLAVEEGGNWSTVKGAKSDTHLMILRRATRIVDRLVRSLGLWRLGHANALRVRRREIDLTFLDLPASFHGYRILQVSDPHFTRLEGITHAITQAIGSIHCDLLVFTGDYADHTCSAHAEVTHHLAAIRSAVAPADGAFGVLGNHDGAIQADQMEEAGVTALLNESVRIDRTGESLLLTGVDDPERFFTTDAVDAFGAHRHSVGDFPIALVHSPALRETAAANGYRLYLCGHHHGGQICLPGGLPLVTLGASRRVLKGFWREGKMVGYTTSGAGVSGLPLRFFSPPEVTLLTLRRH